MIQPYPITVGLRQLRVTKCMFIYVDNLCHDDMGLGLFISPFITLIRFSHFIYLNISFLLILLYMPILV